MKIKKYFTLSFLALATLVCGVSSAHADNLVKAIPSEEILLSRAQAYQSAMEMYLDSKLGNEERRKKYELRNAYLACMESDEKIVLAIEDFGYEVNRRIKDLWIVKCQLGMIKKSDNPDVTLEEFLEKAVEYQTIIDIVEPTKLYQDHALTFVMFKYEVIGSMKYGVSEEEIVNFLKDNGIHNQRLLGKVPYWKMKDLHPQIIFIK